MNRSLKTTLTRSGARRFVLTAALTLTGAGALLATGTLSLTAAHAQASAPDQSSQPASGGCAHHGRFRGEGRPGEPGAMLGPFGGRMLDRMLGDVKATDTQRTQIKQIATAAQKDLQADHEAGRSLHQKMMQILSAPTVDAAAAESVRQQMLTMHNQVSKRSLQAMLDISRVLTPEQRAQLAQRMKDHPWRHGRRPMPGNGPGQPAKQ